MRQSHTRQAPIAIALGGACLFSIGIAGCSRDAGLDLAKDEAKTDSVITERANDAILRSKQELATSGGKSGAKGGVTQAGAEVEEKPTLATRFKAPFKSVGNLLKRKSPNEDEITDPFLARREENAKTEERQVLANASKSAAAEQAKATSPEKKAATSAAGEKKVAMADTAAKSGAGANLAKPKSAESQAALEDFLKSQEPLGVSDRALAASHDSSPITRKPGTAARPASSGRTAEAATVALDDAEAEGISKTGVKSGKARPFPGSTPAGAAEERRTLAATKKPTPERTKTSVAAAAPTHNPLREEEAEPVSTRTKQATGLQIASLLKKAKAAGDVGEFEEAKSYATAASDLAEQCSYEFAAREASPEKVLAWIEAKEDAAAETSIRPKAERHQIAATRRPAREIAASPAGFEKRTAEQIFADEVDATVAAQRNPAGESSFHEWAAGVGKTPIAKGPSPNWPVLSPRELAASDDLWQPSRSESQQQWTDLRSSSAAKDSKKPAETRLASAETDAPAFVATAQVEQPAPLVAAARTSDPIVQLGEPTDLAPGAETPRIASRRGPRLAAPPPLSIEDSNEPRIVATTSKGSSHARTIWYAAVAGLSLIVLLAFRRWAYRSTTE